MADDAAGAASEAGAERDEAGHDEGEHGVERDVLLVDDPVEHEPKQAPWRPTWRRRVACRLRIRSTMTREAIGPSSAMAKNPLVAERAEDDRVD